MRHNYQATADTISRLNRLAHEQLRFRDFAHLKCGRDIFSAKRLDALREMVAMEDAEAIVAEFDNEKDQAVCLRWLLRGLDLDKAIRKVRTDIEIRDNAIEAKKAA